MSDSFAVAFIASPSPTASAGQGTSGGAAGHEAPRRTGEGLRPDDWRGLPHSRRRFTWEDGRGGGGSAALEGGAGRRGGVWYRWICGFFFKIQKLISSKVT